MVQDFQIPKEGDPGCFNFVGEALCDLGANRNLMLLSSFNWIEGLTLRPCFMNVSLEEGRKTELVSMVINMMIGIDGFQFEIHVIVAHDKGKQDCPLIVGRSFLAI